MPKETGSIWKRHLTPAEVNTMARGSMVSHVGIRCSDIGPDSVTATMPVDERTRQPYGLLHGGASMVLAESLASIAGTLAVGEEMKVVGIEINGSHVRPVTSGYVSGRASPVRLGGKIQVWKVEITDENHEVVCVSRVTLAVLENRETRLERT